MINENFISDLIIIDEALTESLNFSKLFDFDENIEIILSSMIQIIRELEINNHVEKFASEPSKLVEKLIDNNNLLTVNELFIVKVKDRFQRTKNKKEIMTRAEKAKTKFIKRDSFDFKHVEVNLRRDDRDDRDDHDDRDERSSKEVKKFFVTDTAAIMKANIQTIEKKSAVIDRDIQEILTRVEVKAKTKKASSNDFIVNIDKTTIEVSSDDEFEAFIIDEEVMNMFS